MSPFAARCGIHDEAREQAVARVGRLIEAQGLELVRFAWCDLHGVQRGKTLVASAAAQAMRDGVGMVSTLMLKDTSDRTAFKVFEPGGTASLPGFGFANNLMLVAGTNAGVGPNLIRNGGFELPLTTNDWTIAYEAPSSAPVCHRPGRSRRVWSGSRATPCRTSESPRP